MSRTQEKKTTLVSIVVPVYKTAQYLDRCVESILKQTLCDIEVILVDDGSPDECPQMCDAWARRDKRVHVIHKTNGGPQSAVIAGVVQAASDYIGFVDADDWILPTMFQALYEAAKTYHADCVRGGIRMIEPDGSERILGGDQLQILHTQEIEKEILTPFWEENANLYELHWSNGRWDKLFRAEILQAILPHLERSLSIGEDTEMNLRALPLCQTIVSLPNAYFYCAYQHEASITHSYSNRLLEQNAAYLTVLKHLCQEQNRQGKALQNLTDRLYAWTIFQIFQSNNRQSLAERCNQIAQARQRICDATILDTTFSTFNFAVRQGMSLIQNGHIKVAVFLYATLLQIARKLKRLARR